MQRLILALSMVLLLQGCTSLAGIGHKCRQHQVPGNLQATLHDACSGNQHASLAIGQHFENLAESGSTVSDYSAAAYFYELASASSSGQTYIYVPGAGNVAGYTMPVTTGPRTTGLPEARQRLARLYYEGLGVRQNRNKACKLVNAKTGSDKAQVPGFECDK